MRKLLLPLLFLLLAPIALAQQEECGLTNLAVCIPQKLYEYTLGIFNAPLQPLLNFVNFLLTDAVNIDSLSYFWAIIVYIISIFYALFMLFAGFNFIISSHDVVRREKAKIWLRNVILMIFLVQTSFFIYALFLEINSALTAGVISLINQDFFLLTVDNIANLGLELLLYFTYVIILVITVVSLALRYLFVMVGVMAFPMGLFLYFIPPLQSYGKLIINLLAVIILTTFIDALILLMGAQLLLVPGFENIKIIVMISSFFLVNVVNILLGLFIVSKSVSSVTGPSLSLILNTAKKIV